MKSVKFLFSALCLSAMVLLVSCGKDKDVSEGPIDSKLTAEEHKEKLSAIGVDFVNDIDEIADEPLIAIMIQFDELSSEYEIAESMAKFAPIQYLNQYTELQDNPKKVLDLKSVATYMDDEPETMSELWDEMVGTYTFNSETMMWDYTEATDEVTFIFPSNETNLENGVNDVNIRIFDFAYQDATSETVQETSTELPTSLQISVTTTASDQIFGLDMTASYYSDDMPKLMENSMDMVYYSWNTTMDMTDRSKEMSMSSSYKKGSEVIAAFNLDIKANFDMDAIQEALDNEDITAIQDLLNNGNASFQVNNLKLVGFVDVKNMIADMTDLSENLDESTTEEEYIDAMVKVYNDNINLYLMYVSENEVIARAEAYAYYDTEWAEYTFSWRIVFTDGTAFDDSYFEEGFEDFFDEMDDFILEMEELYPEIFEDDSDYVY